MLIIRKEDIIHKSVMNRLLMEIADNTILSQYLAFKGGTCAAMLGYLDRFSVDLDFDVLPGENKENLRQEFYEVFKAQSLEIAKEKSRALFFQVRYQSTPKERNLMKVSASDIFIKTNLYKALYLAEINRIMKCQSVESMFANKLVAITDRYNLYRKIAGRDIYDLHYFFTHGYSYRFQIIEERTGMGEKEYLRKLSAFIRKHVTQKLIDEDLNTLLADKQFKMIRKIIIPETLSILEKSINP